MIIEEDYVSFETARLLKEKGFNEKCREYYVKSKECGIEFYSGGTCDYNTVEGIVCSAPTLQRVMKWLREKYNVVCNINIETRNFYYYAIYKIVSAVEAQYQLSSQKPYFETYEEAAEEAIKYCLEKLV